MKIEYPKWVYWQDIPGGEVKAKIIQSPAELMPGMCESPQALVPIDVAPNLGRLQAALQSQVDAPVVPTSSFVALNAQVDATIERFYRLPARVIASRVAGLTTQAEVDEVLDIERARPAGPRQTVLDAVAARTEALREAQPASE